MKRKRCHEAIALHLQLKTMLPRSCLRFLFRGTRYRRSLLCIARIMRCETMPTLMFGLWWSQLCRRIFDNTPAIPLNADRKTIQTTIVREWKERWQREVDRSRARHRGRAEEPADEPPAKERLKLHDGLQKAESSLLVQMRTGKIGLSNAGCRM
jgi:hypothetical protein